MSSETQGVDSIKSRAVVSRTPGLRCGEFFSFHVDSKAAKSCGVVVVLIGWMGARSRHLRKYVEVWRDIGAPKILCFIPPGPLPWQIVESATAFQAWFKGEGERVGHRYIFHVFSNNGALCLAEIFRRDQTGVICNHVHGLIFDSCPGSLQFSLLYKALMAGRNPLWKRILIRAFFLGIPIVAALVVLLKVYGSRQRWRRLGVLMVAAVMGQYGSSFLDRRYHSTIYNSRLRNCARETFLYSKVDELCTQDVIEQVVSARRAFLMSSREGGERRVHTHVFEASGHVQHLLHHRHAYEEACRATLLAVHNRRMTS